MTEGATTTATEQGRSVLVTGASRGLGLEFARQYAAAGWRVIATCREPGAASSLLDLERAHPSLEVRRLDVLDEASIDALATALEGRPLHLLINNAGVYGRKRLPLAEVDPGEWIEVLRTNTIAPFLITRALLPNLAAAPDAAVAVLGSKVGSVEDNSSGGNYAYRTSKAALNQVVRNLSFDLAPHGVRIVVLHPGWVKTEMGGPSALIEPEESVAGMRRVIATLARADSGAFLSYRGEPIPW